MAYLRLTLLRPRPDAEDEVLQLLGELDSALAGADGLLFSFVLSQNARAGRVSVWRSKDEANREAMKSHVLSLRSRLRYLALETEETLLFIHSGFVPEGFSILMNSAKQAASLPAVASQPAFPG